MLSKYFDAKATFTDLNGRHDINFITPNNKCVNVFIDIIYHISKSLDLYRVFIYSITVNVFYNKKKETYFLKCHNACRIFKKKASRRFDKSISRDD